MERLPTSNPLMGIIWYNFAMRMLPVVIAFCMSISVFGVTIPELPQSAFADTEVSTNIAFAVDRAMMTRIEFAVALDATPTNNVEVAIGTDANGDGNLAPEEAAYVFGYDCGRWFTRVGELFDCSIVQLDGAGRLEKTFILKMRKRDTTWNLVKVTRRGCGATCELVKAEGRKPGFKLEVR